MKLLFIGNSHTYYNAMPETVLRFFEATGQKTHVTMLAEGGKDLIYHASVPNVPFNIRCGKYDMIIAQDRATGFDPAAFREGAKALKEMADKAGSQFFLYMPWAGRENREAQHIMTEAYHSFSQENGCPFAPTGEVFSRILLNEEPSLIYREDGNHATPLGSYIAAATVFYTVTGRKRIINVNALDDPGIAAGFPAELCQRIHTEACRTTRLYNG
ncbi:MAG: hypothetical protein E7585_06895 [Ruminococcaceae bacterium]|nr:hypothetical protein [Oscillospiraceae bacterium]